MLRPSRALATIVLCLHVAAGACLAIAIPGTWGVVLALLVAALGAAVVHDRALLRSARSPRILELRGDADSTLQARDGSTMPLGRGRGLAHRHWAVLETRGPIRGRVLVASDMMDAEDFRRVRLWALWGRLPGGARRVSQV